MYDVNPVPHGEMLALNVSLDDARINTDLAIEVAPFFGIHEDEAAKTVEGMISVIGQGWRPIAEKYGLNRQAQMAMEPAFMLC